MISFEQGGVRCLLACCLAGLTFWSKADEPFVKAYGSHPRQMIDVWLPKDAVAVPMAIYVHGGGWTSGSSRDATASNLLAKCQKAGCAFASVEYRFLRDADVRPPLRTPISDVAKAIGFVLENSTAWGVDRTRIGLTGGSAGACAALAVSLSNGNRLGIRAVAAAWPQTSLDPREMRDWVPNITYGASAFGYRDFDDWLSHRSESLPWIDKFSPAVLLRACPVDSAPVILVDRAKATPPGELPKDPTHAAAFRHRFAALCREKGISCQEVWSVELHDRLLAVLSEKRVKGAGVSVANVGFDADAGTGRVAGWSATGNWRIERGAGLNAGVGLVWEDEAIKEPARLICPVQGWKTGTAYHFDVWYRTGRFSCPARLTSARICVEWFDKAHKWLGGNYAPVIEATNAGLAAEWRRMEGVTCELPPETAFVEMQIFVMEGCSGCIQWDNVSIEPLTKPVVEFAACSAYDATAAAGTVRFCAALNGEEIDRVDFEWTDDKGGVCRRSGPIADGAAGIVLDVSALKMGRQEIVARAFGGGKEKGHAACAFTRVSSLPRRKIDFDSVGRCLVDGKPFFPLGMYASAIEKSWIDVYAKGPFNCVAVYGETKRKGLDLCDAAGLKVMVDLRHGVFGTAGAVQANIDTPEKSRAFLKREIGALKDHPAVLAWYLNDEAPATRIPDILRAYQTARAEDKDHPVWAVMDRLYDLRGFTPTCDVIGVDPYPIPSRSLRDVADYALGARKIMFRLRPMWNVPQAIDRAWYWKDLVGHSHFPTEHEMRSFCWQHVASGANGLVLYAFHDYLRRQKKGEDLDIYWNVACKIGGEVRDRMPLLLSNPADAPVPDSKDVICRSWEFEGGATTLVCSLSSGPVKTSLRFADGRVLPLELEAYGTRFVK